MFRQFELRSHESRLVCWLEEQPGLREERRLTLQGDDRIWTVVWRGETRLTQPPERRWQVGGLQ